MKSGATSEPDENKDKETKPKDTPDKETVDKVDKDKDSNKDTGSENNHETDTKAGKEDKSDKESEVKEEKSEEKSQEKEEKPEKVEKQKETPKGSETEKPENKDMENVNHMSESGLEHKVENTRVLNEVEISKKKYKPVKSQGAIIALALGLAITAMLLVFVGCRLRNVKHRLRRGRPMQTNEADYLINGMYL